MIKKVLFVCSIYKPNVGGVETAIEELCAQYHKLGIQTTVLTKKYPFDLADYDTYDGTEVIRVLRPKTEEENIALLKQLITDNRLKADVIHVMGIRRPLPMFALYLARLWHVPVIMNFVGNDVLISNDSENFKIWEEGRKDTIYAVPQADGFISFSKGISEAAQKDMPSIKNIQTIYAGIDLNKIHHAIPKQNLGLYIMTARRLIYNKGIDILINAFSLVLQKFPNLTLYIVGDGSEKNNLIKQTHKCGISNHVFFTGTTDLEELFSYMKGALIHICPSRAEGGGIVNVEASACGCVPIGACVDGIPEYIQDQKTGLLFEPENETDLANKIIYLLENRDKLQLFKDNGYRFAATFDIQLKAKEYLKMYDVAANPRLIPWSENSKKLLEMIENAK